MNSREQRLSGAFVALADTLVRDFDLTELLHTLTSTCVELLQADAACILLVEPGGGLRVIAASSDTVRVLDLFELQAEEGPCLDCIGAAQHVVSVDLDGDGRWPVFAPRAVEAGYRSVNAVPMRLRDEMIGALNLFGVNPGALSSEEVALAQALADVASIGLVQARLVRESQLVAAQLQQALTSRVVIEQAKGMLAEQGRVSVGAAFTLLRAQARRRSITIGELARAVVDGSIDHRALSSE